MISYITTYQRLRGLLIYPVNSQTVRLQGQITSIRISKGMLAPGILARAQVVLGRIS